MEFKDYVSEIVNEKVNELMLGDSNVVEALKKLTEEDAKVQLYKRLIRNNGKLSDSSNKKYNLKDLITSPEFSYFFPRVITSIAGEVYDNSLVITPLLEEIMVDPGPSLTIQVPQFTGAFGQSLDVGESGEYPELNLKMTGGTVATVTIGKSGIAVNITEEAIKYSRFDIFNAAINEAMKALARWKERKAVKMFYESAKTIKSTFKGVGIDGKSNDGLSLDDILEVALEFMENGFNMDTIIMHPLAYPIFAMNGTMRSFFWASLGDKGSLFTWPQVSGGQPELYKTLGKVKPLNGENITSFEVPTGIIGKPLRLILSPAVPFDKSDKATDIIVLDSENLGYLITAERPVTDEFTDPMRDITHFKVRERYGMAPKYDGSAIGILKGVKAVETFDPIPFYSINIDKK